MHYMEPAFLAATLQIIWINILLSGDNAVVIALACRSLEKRQRFWGMLLGACAAVGLRIAFTLIVTQLMNVPFLKFVGGIALLWIAIKLTAPEDENGDVKAGENVWNAVRIIAVADLIMSLDNVIAIAAAAHGSWELIIFGLVLSVPLIIAGAALLTAVLERFPILVWAGAALLGWIAGQIMIEDQFVAKSIGEAASHALKYYTAGAGALFVVAVGYAIRHVKDRKNESRSV